MKATATKKTRTRAARGTGRLYKRTKDGKEFPADSKVEGVFWIQYTVNGKRKRHALTGKDGNPITDKRNAEAERKRLTAPMRAGKREEQLEGLIAAFEHAGVETERATDEAAAAITLSQAWEAFTRSPDRPDSGMGTLSYYLAYWNAFRKWIEESNPEIQDLREITPRTAADYAASLNEREITPNTYNKHIGFLRLFFRTLGEQAGIKLNPFSKVRRKNLKTQSRRELTIAELREVLTNAKGDLQTLLAIGTFTGLRLGDCCTLQWGEVDLDRGLIRRIPNKTAKNNKPVLIGIPPALHVVLARIPAGERKGYVLPRFAEMYAFQNNKGRHTKQPEITNEIQAHFINCGIRIHKEGTGFVQIPCKYSSSGFRKEYTGKRAVVEVGFHSLRHTYVSLHAERGTPQALIQGNVGHSNPAMTSHYLHVNEETAIKTAQVLSLESPEGNKKKVPAWIVKKLKAANEGNWKEIIEELIQGGK